MPVSTWIAAFSFGPCARRKRSPFLDLLEGAEHRAQVEFRIGRAGAGQEPVQHVDRRIGRNGAGADRLAQMRDEEGAAAGTGKGRHGLLDADAIGVGLDDSRGVCAAGVVAQDAPVRGEGVEIDMEDATRGVLRDRREWCWSER